MSEIFEKVELGAEALKKLCPNFPKHLVVLGSGLANLLERLTPEQTLRLSNLPGVRSLTVEGHVAELRIGTLEGVRVACMKGRLHYYEGYPLEDVVFPFRIFARSGCENFLLTNAAGGLHADMVPRDIVLIKDHINVMGTNPLIGPNPAALGKRFPDLTDLYNREYRKMALAVAKERNIPMTEGVYIATHGPSYETPAEIKMYRTMGADVVGMSTVPEAIALHHMGKRVLAFSCVTNLAAGVTHGPLDHAEVLASVEHGHDGLCDLICGVLRKIEGARS